MADKPDYSQWSPERLQERIRALDIRLEHLEKQMANGTSTPKTLEEPKIWRKAKNPRSERHFDPSKYSTRLIALKFAYLGQNYNGLEYHAGNSTPLPTIEEVLWKALNKARLIFPSTNPAIMDNEPNFEGCEYSKCGRTDKGVSAFGQVVGIRVRSSRPLSRAPTPIGVPEEEIAEYGFGTSTQQIELAAPALKPGPKTEDDLPTPPHILSLDEETLSFHPTNDEIPYCQVLNRLLPPDIRILAWCPAPPLDFSARFSCKERRYRYFFTQPAFTPTPGPEVPLHGTAYEHRGKLRQGWLDIAAMQEAAQKFEGLHDFRNFCKVDASKQIDNFERRIFHASVGEMGNSGLPAAYVSQLGFSQFEHDDTPMGQSSRAGAYGPKIFAFDLHGSAFLWHQVRHMISILFLIGQGLEPPSLVDDLLDVAKTPCKPQYEMADDAPLVLWDCIFPREGGDINPDTGRGEDAMEWVYVGDAAGLEPGLGKAGSGKTDGKFGFGGVVDDLWRVWRGRKMDEVLAGTLLNRVVQLGGREGDGERGMGGRPVGKGSQKVFQGADGPRFVGRYVKVLEKPRMESVEVINGRYAKKKGFEEREEVRGQGVRRLELGREEGVVEGEDREV